MLRRRSAGDRRSDGTRFFCIRTQATTSDEIKSAENSWTLHWLFDVLSDPRVHHMRNISKNEIFRLQKKNQRRGNITAHFNTPSVPDVQEIVNEINGISFNSVLNR